MVFADRIEVWNPVGLPEDLTADQLRVPCIPTEQTPPRALDAEVSKADALIQFPFNPELVDAAAKDFDAVVHKIRNKKFTIATLPEKSICKECQVRSLCAGEGII